MLGAEIAPVAPVPAEERAAPPSRIEDLLGQLKARPRDHKVQLELARAYRDERDWDSALKQYEKLIGARKLVPAVIDDLKPLLDADVNKAQLYQLLGDAYMQEDRLDEALAMYRQARQALAR